MPTYDYVCGACGHAFELFQQMSDPVRRKCPECGKLRLDRLIGTGADIIFKGGGFYQTDYRSESYRKGADAEKKSTEKPKADTAKSGGESAAGAPKAPKDADRPKSDPAPKPPKKRSESAD